jgi:selenocysteine lyase/cysteine desulfurase
VGYDVEALRAQQFPLTRNTVYLNHAGVSPIPQRTFDVLQKSNEYLLLDPALGWETWFFPRFEAFNETMRGLINAESPEEIVGVQSTGFGLNLVAQALPWKRGENLVVCDIEFPSNVYPWMRLADQHGVEIRFVQPDEGGVTPDLLKRHIDANTRLVAVSAIQFLTGHRTDLKAIGALCRERGILHVVDAIQAAGHIPIDVQAMHIDILSTGGQKSLMGPPGQGFLYIRRQLADQIEPTMISSISVEDYLHWLKYDLNFRPGAARFNQGTPGVANIVGLQESVAMLRELGLANIDAYVTALADYLIERVKAKGWEVITPAAHGPIVTFRAAETDEATAALVKALAAQRIFVVKHWDKQDIAYIRASLHCYNNVADIDNLLMALKEARA